MKTVIDKGRVFNEQKDFVIFYRTNIYIDIATNSPFISSSRIDISLLQSNHRIYEFKNQILIDLTKPLKSIYFKEYNAKTYVAKSDEKVLSFLLGAIQWLTWNRSHCYCGYCGNDLQLVEGAYEKKCVQCNALIYPSLSPAIMVLIKKEHQLLLARGPHFTKGVYSSLAGFIDIGETAEQAVHREVFEEVGILVKSIKYFGTQSWPFPGSFMIGFTAEYLDGEITIDQNELEDAKWFDLNQLPLLPSKNSLSRKLIDSAF